MTSLPLARPVQPSLFRPPITRLPGAPATSAHSYDLHDLASRSRSWHRQAIALPVPVTCAFWLVAAASGAVGGWATAVLTHKASCRGVVCRVGLLGDRPLLVAVLAAACVVVLLVLAAITRGLTRAGGPELAAMVVAAGAGVVSVLGVVAVVVLTVLVVLMSTVALVLLLDRD
jgi:hypothetical protein